jgi:hypothetical protein
MDKLKYIINELNSIKASNKYIFEAIIERKQYYNDTAHMLENVTEKQIKDFCFLSEVLRKAEILEKQKFYKILINKAVKLETHQNAPELNCIHFKRRKIDTPKATTITDAISQIISNTSLTCLNGFIYELS